MNVKTYNNKLYLSSSLSTQIFNDPNIPALKELRSEIRVMDQTKQITQGTLENLLLWARSRQNESVAFIFQVGSTISRHGKAETSQHMAGETIRKELAENSGDGGVTPAGKQYRLELGISDATAHVVVVMFDETGSELVKCSADSLAQSDEEYLDDTSGLPAALANIIGTTHTLELKSHTYYEHGTFKSFTCWNLIPLEVVVDSAGSSTIDVVRDTPGSFGKRLCKQSAVATPLKACEGKTPIRQKADNEQPKGERTKTAEVWNEFERVEKNGLTKARCNHCGTLLAYNKSRTTTTLTRHLKFHCEKRKLVIQKQGLLNFQLDGLNVSSSEPDLALAIVNGKYDHMRMQESIAHWILMHEHSFSIVVEAGFDFMMKVGIPQWPGLSRTSTKYDCLRVYENQKIKFKEMLKKVDSISLTTDMWKSKCQNIGYMVITGHFLDKDWKLNKWVLNFVHVPPSHRGIDISDALYKCFQEWDIEKKIYSISMDNTSANDNAIKNIKRIFEVDRKLLCDGRLFHVRCCAHILNLIAQDGLETIKSVIKNVRDNISFIKCGFRC
ncbi:zinc finger BED domain-containing protein RICESLEEPER 2-like protein [Tanacetum coccineum]|uniref:Zinc finger BED domain-containing protein RICESLEEPER 2-like protein n=1 Tax=Tanacetum coccineum TaxID=301880 RepID=A0ABQ5DLU2_9ASTR